MNVEEARVNNKAILHPVQFVKRTLVRTWGKIILDLDKLNLVKLGYGCLVLGSRIF